MAQDYANTMFEAVSILIDKKISSIKFDRTIEATIVDASNAELGEYLVTTGTAKFKAYCSETKYRVNDQVMVTVPEGDYDNQKIIIGKKIDNTENALLLETPFSKIISLQELAAAGDATLTANYNGIDEAGAQEIHKSITNIKELLLNTTSGYTRLGIAADFQTLLQDYQTVSGSYGVKAILTFSSGESIEMALSNDLFFGNTYNFVTPSHQEAIFNIEEYANLDIESIDLVFYQSGDFKDIDGLSVDYEVEPNIYISNVTFVFGIDTAEFTGESAKLFTSDLTYLSNTEKQIKLQWVHQDETTGTIVAITDTSIPVGYSIHWFRYVLGEPSPGDVSYVGAHWKEINKQEDNISTIFCDFIPDSTNRTEQIKAVITRDDVDEDSYGDYVVTSNILTLTNNVLVPDKTTVQAVNALTVEYTDGTFGNYFIYNRSNHILSDESNTLRSLKLMFKGADLTEASDIYFTWPDTIRSMITLQNTNLYELQEDGYHFKSLSSPPYYIYYSINDLFVPQYTDNLITITVVKDGINYSTFVEMLFGPAGTSGSDYTLNIKWDTNDNAFPWTGNSTDSWAGKVILQNQQGQVVEIPSTSTLTYKWAVAPKPTTTSLSASYWVKGTSVRYPLLSETNDICKPLRTNLVNFAQDYYINGAPNAIYDDVAFNFITNEYDKTYDGNTNIIWYRLVAMPKRKMEFKPIDIVNTTDTINDNIDIKIVDGKVVYYYNTTRRAFIKWNDSYVLDQFVGYQPDLTYYYPVYVNQIDYSMLSETDLDIRKDSTDQTRFSIQGSIDSNDLAQALYVLKITLSNFGDYNLVSYFPIPIKCAIGGQTPSYAMAPSIVRYDTTGEVDYYKNTLKCYFSSSYNPTQTWEILYNEAYDDSANSFAPMIKDNVFQPAGIYTEYGIPPYGIGCRINGQLAWIQPIFLLQDNYPSSTLNKWGGKEIETDENAGTIVANGFAAGKKEDDNTFTGVVLGDWSRSDTAQALTKSTGVFGFNHGSVSYALKDDGTAFFGKDGCGRIYFDGNKAQIYSASWNTPTEQGTLYERTSKGMFLDIDDGILQIKNLNHFVTLSAEGTIDNPFFAINKDNKNLFYIDSNNYYLQSSNYNGNAHTGTKLDLSTGELIGYNFTINAFANMHSENGYNFTNKKIILSSDTENYPQYPFEISSIKRAIGAPATEPGEDIYTRIKWNGTLETNNIHITGGDLIIGENFAVTNDGKLTAAGAEISGTITATSGKIGNWFITSGTNKNGMGDNASIGLSTVGIYQDTQQKRNNSPIRFYAGGQLNSPTNLPFCVTDDGSLYSSKIQATGGEIGGWTIGTNSLTGDNNKVILATTWDDNNSKTIAGQSSANWRILVNDQFGVTREGNIHCTTLYATGGKIGGLNIGSTLNAIKCGGSEAKTNWALHGGAASAGNGIYPFGLDQSGHLYVQAGAIGRFVFENDSIQVAYSTQRSFKLNSPSDITDNTPAIQIQKNLQGSVQTAFGVDYGGRMIYQAGTYGGSDKRFKMQIHDISTEYEENFDKLKPQVFTLKNDNKLHFGFIAQDIIQEFPLATYALAIEEQDYLYLSYNDFIPLNTWQIQKLKKRVSDLEDKIAKLEAIIEKLV